MDRDIALRIDAMLMGIRASLDAVAYYAKNNCTAEESKLINRLIGQSMGGTIQVSDALYEEHPDIIPRELKPESR